MTVASTTNRVSYTGNGSTTVFAFGHPYRASSDLVVTVRTVSTGAESLKQETVDYTVSGTPTSDAGGFASGSVTFLVAPASGTQVHIDRVVTRTQAVDFVSGDSLPPSSIEGSLDKLTQITQELDSRFDRTLLQPRTAVNRNLVMPEPNAGNASYFLRVNASGDALVWNEGAVSNGDKGDITVTGTGNTWTIDDDAITTQKIQNNAVITAKIADGNVSTAKLADGAVTTGKLDNGAVTSAKIADNTIVNADINSAAAIAHTKLASITGGRVLMGNSSDIPTATVIGGDATLAATGDLTIGASAVTTSKINDNAVTNAKLDDMAANRIKGTISSGDPSDLTGTQVTTLLDVFTSTLKGLVPLSGGGTANFLRADGSWTTPPAVSDGTYTDITVSSSGSVWNINANAVGTNEIADSAVTSAKIADGAIVNADINATAAIAYSKLAAAASGQLLVGDTGGTLVARTISGDVSISNTGVTAIGAGVIVDADISNSAGITNSKLATMAANTIKGVSTSGTPTDLSASSARTVLGLGTLATQDASNVTITGGSITGISGFLSDSNTSTQNAYFGDIHLRDDATPSHYLAVTAGDNLTASRTLTLKTNDASRTLDMTTVAPSFDTVAAVNAATIDSQVNHIRTAGYYQAGDGGGALYRRIATPSPVKAWHITSSGSVYWELCEAQPNVLMLGAKGDGTTDDSTAFQAAIDYAQDKGRNIVYIPGGQSSQQYKIKNINIPNGLTVSGYGAYVKDTGLTGVNHIFKLTGYNTSLVGVQISSASNVSASHAAVVCEDTFYVTLRDIRIIDAVNGVKLTAATQSSEGTIDNVIVNTFSGKGFWFGPNVNQIRVTNCWADSGQTQVSAGPPATYRPKSNTTGFLMDASGSTVAYGGHLFTNCGTLNCATGWDLAYAALTSYTNCIADNHSGAGVRVGQAGACNNLIFDSMFIGVCGAGIDVKNANTNSITFNGLVTTSIGEIPSGAGGAPTFFTHDALYSSPYYDVIQNSTSFCTINVDSWRAAGANAYRISEATDGNIQTLGGFLMLINSQGTVAAGSTVYLSLFGQAANENDAEMQWPRALYGALVPARVVLLSADAPGAGQTYTYTVRFSGSDQMTAATSGASSYGPVFTGNPLIISPAQSVTVKLVTSAGANATRHRGYIQIFAKPT